ncbi:MAG: redoxin domain-containing protein [Gemmataceae bacterium]|nr:redoxin domain-containing protein [Gemmataceae bacterium]
MLGVLLLLAAPKPDLRDIEGRAHALGAKATVLLFVMADCPISNSYAPEMERIRKDYAGKGVAFFIVHADPDTTAAQARKHARDYALGCPVLLDPRHVLAKRAGATKAPEAAVLAPETVYRGRIDDAYLDFGKRREKPTRRDLRLALDAVLAGKKPDKAVAPVIGCDLPDPAK